MRVNLGTMSMALALLACSVEGDVIKLGDPGTGNGAAGTPSTGTGGGGPDGSRYYFSDCQSGAEVGCIPGDNAAAGTSPEAPKRDLVGFDVDALPAGAQVLLAQGGAWENFSVQLHNLNVTPSSPLIFDSYAPSWGGTAKPWLKVTTNLFAFEFGAFDDVDNDGGYTVRNLKLDGLGVAGAWGVHLKNDARNVTLESLEITGFEIGVYSQNSGPAGNTFLTVRDSTFHHNSDSGIRCDAFGVVIEGNTFTSNNSTGSASSHAIFLGGKGADGVIRNNTLTDNSTVGGVCSGGNLTVHGQWDGLLIEGNSITQVASESGCYGISIIPTFDSPEWFRDVVVRGNTIVNLGFTAIAVASAPGIVIENNNIINTQATYQSAISIPAKAPGPGDDADTGAIVRNNTIYFSQAGAGSEGIAIKATSGSSIQVTSNLIYFGADADASHYCFVHTELSSFTAFSNNLCHHAGGNGAFSSAYGTLASAMAAGFDDNGLSSDPLFVAAPASGNNWDEAVQAASPAVDAGHATLSSPQDRLGRTRVVPDIGSRER